MNLNKYKTIVFDCDGVILNSNHVKTCAFYNTTLHYGEGFASKLRDFHIQHGGISRYKKFEYFLTDIIGKPLDQKELKRLLDQFSKEVKKSLMSCEIAKHLGLLRNKTSKSKWLIVSGGDQDELREVFKYRGIFDYFDGGIFGSPDDKNIIIKRETKINNIVGPAVFIGDSEYDYCVSRKNDLNFIFMSQWTEFKKWEKFCIDNNVDARRVISDL